MNDPAPRVTEILRSVRAVADELVVALDARVDPAPFAAAEAIADQFHRAEYPGTLEQALPWLYEQCGGDWVLRLDGDELPSHALLERLDRLDGLEEVVGASIRRAWLWGDGDEVLAASPWWPDPQLRLLANRPGLIRFPDHLHHALQVDGPIRYLDEPIYHAALLTADVTARRAKAMAYETLNPGLRANGGVAQNGGYYLPEAAGRQLRTAPLSEQDRDAVARLLHPPAQPESAVRWPVVRVEEIVPDHFGPELGPGDYEASITFTDGALDVIAGSETVVDLRVKNLGGAWWPREAPHRLIRLGARWRGPDGQLAVADGLREALPQPVGPGTEVSVLLHLPVPSGPPGRYELEVDVVHEHVRWFGCPATKTADVRSAPAIALHLHGAASGADAAGAERLRTLLATIGVDLPEARVVLVTADPKRLARTLATAVVDPVTAAGMDWAGEVVIGELLPGGEDRVVAAIADRLAATRAERGD